MVEDDLGLVPKAALKKCLRALEENPEKGKPLGGPLKGLRSTHVGSDNRLVYQLLKQKKGEDIVEVIAIGRRRAEAAYKTAGKRI